MVEISCSCSGLEITCHRFSCQTNRLCDRSAASDDLCAHHRDWDRSSGVMLDRRVMETPVYKRQWPGSWHMGTGAKVPPFM